MKEYIEREAALLEIEEWADTFCECDYVWPHVIKSIRKLPDADVRPVVLCGDCEFYGCRMDALREVGFCKRTDAITGAFDFCSHGEKREES